MNWIKGHKLWSLLFLYFFGVGVLVNALLSVLGIVDTAGFGFIVGLFWPVYLLLCFILLKIFDKVQGKEDEKV